MNLCEKAYEIIKSSKKEEISKLSNNSLNEYLEFKFRNFTRHLNNLLLPYSDNLKDLNYYVLSILKINK